MVQSTREIFIAQLEQRLTLDLGPRDHDWGSFPTAETPLFTWLRDGTVFTHLGGDDAKLSVRVPLVSQLSISSEILDWISTRNSAQYAGHYWLRPGSDENHWQLVCEVKIPWDWIDQNLANILLQVCPGLGTVLNRDVGREFMARFGGEQWWDTTCSAEQMGSQILALLD